MIRSETPPSTAQRTRCRGEMFTLQWLKLPPSLYKPCHNRCDRESAERCAEPHGESTVARSGDGGALVASAWLLNEKNFRKIDGHRVLWASATIFDRQPLVQQSQEKVE
jgi:hypothetical protein